MDLTTKGLWLLDRPKVFTISPLLVQTISLVDKVLPPTSIAGSGVMSPFEEVLCLPSGYHAS